MLEAAACGRPLIAADVPGCREVVRPGATGILVPPHDVDALAGSIAALARDPARRATMGRAGREWIESGFTDEIVARDTLALYHSALADRGRFPAPQEKRKTPVIDRVILSHRDPGTEKRDREISGKSRSA